MDSPLPQGFLWNLGPALQSNPLIPSWAFALQLPRSSSSSQHIQTAPAWPPQRLLKYTLHSKIMSSKAAKHKKCLDMPHKADQARHTSDNCVISREGYWPFPLILLPPGCRTSQDVRKLSSMSSSLGGGSKPPSSPHYSCYSDACWQATQKGRFKGDMFLANMNNAMTKCWMQDAKVGNVVLARGSGATVETVFISNSNRLPIIWSGS